MVTSVTDMGLISPTVTGTDMVMINLNNKIGRGMTLNSCETLIPITVGAHAANYAFGPDMAHFTVPTPDLPEIAKGALANYSS
ncbi:MAG: hypothetical protein J5861_06945 [Desulfovibrio sp.]|nr:hypothetical protein [Desulfovibrio sp.]